MQLTSLNVASRAVGSSRLSNRSRKSGSIPAIYYGGGQSAVPVSVVEKELEAVLAPGKRYTLLDLVIDGKAGNPAIVHQYQKDNISQKITHLDFLKIDENTPVTVRVKVNLNGIPFGVKNQGGQLSQENRYLKLSAKPADIPRSIELDISEMPNNITFYAEKLELGNAKLVSKPRTVIFTISKGRGASAETTAEAAPDAAAGKEEAAKKDAKKK